MNQYLDNIDTLTTQADIARMQSFTNDSTNRIPENQANDDLTSTE